MTINIWWEVGLSSFACSPRKTIGIALRFAPVVAGRIFSSAGLHLSGLLIKASGSPEFGVSVFFFQAADTHLKRAINRWVFFWGKERHRGMFYCLSVCSFYGGVFYFPSAGETETKPWSRKMTTHRMTDSCILNRHLLLFVEMMVQHEACLKVFTYLPLLQNTSSRAISSANHLLYTTPTLYYSEWNNINTATACNRAIFCDLSQQIFLLSLWLLLVSCADCKSGFNVGTLEMKPGTRTFAHSSRKACLAQIICWILLLQCKLLFIHIFPRRNVTNALWKCCPQNSTFRYVQQLVTSV